MDIEAAPDQANDPLVLLYVTCSSEDEAASLGSRLLEQNLIACANLYPSRSLYRWEGKIVDEPETVMVCKTLRSSAEAASGLIKQLHSYDVPAIIRMLPVSANDDYYAWVFSEVAAQRKAI